MTPAYILTSSDAKRRSHWLLLARSTARRHCPPRVAHRGTRSLGHTPERTPRYHGELPTRGRPAAAENHECNGTPGAGHGTRRPLPPDCLPRSGVPDGSPGPFFRGTVSPNCPTPFATASFLRRGYPFIRGIPHVSTPRNDLPFPPLGIPSLGANPGGDPGISSQFSTR